jgi:hypothetical protein
MCHVREAVVSGTVKGVVWLEGYIVDVVTRLLAGRSGVWFPA